MSSGKTIAVPAAAAAAIALGHVVGLAAFLLYNSRKEKVPEEPTTTSSWSSSSAPLSSSPGGAGGAAGGGPKYVLAGDIGGTNSRLSLHLPNDKTPLLVQEYRNDDALRSSTGKGGFKSFADGVVLPFLTQAFTPKSSGGEGLDAGDVVSCFACAGPVLRNRVVMTNIKGLADPVTGKIHEVVIDGKEIEGASDGSYLKHVVRCKIVNDFVGQGYGAVDLDLTPQSTEVVELKSGSRDLLAASKASGEAPGPMACVGAGTGLGECYLTCSSLDPAAGYECYPSEGGHIEYAPRSDVEVDLLASLKKKFASTTRVSVERVVSGKGLANVYEFLSMKYPDKVDKKIHEEFLAAGDMQGKVVGVNSSRSKPGHPLCVQAMEIMMGAYGSEVGSAALKFIPTGGMFVTGGLTPKNVEWIKGKKEEGDSPFMKAYLDKGRVSGVLGTVPLFAVLAEDLGLRGARVCAMREYNNIMSKK